MELHSCGDYIARARGLFSLIHMSYGQQSNQHQITHMSLVQGRMQTCRTDLVL